MFYRRAIFSSNRELDLWPRDWPCDNSTSSLISIICVNIVKIHPSVHFLQAENTRYWQHTDTQSHTDTHIRRLKVAVSFAKTRLKNLYMNIKHFKRRLETNRASVKNNEEQSGYTKWFRYLAVLASSQRAYAGSPFQFGG